MGDAVQLLVFAGLFGVMWLVLIRPQRKRQQEQAELVAGVSEGDDVITVGGLHGSVVGTAPTTVDLAVDADGTVLRFRRDAIREVVGAPVEVTDDPDDDADDDA